MKLLGSKNKKNLFYFVLRSVCTIFVPAETELDVRLSDHLPVRGDRVAYPDVPSSLPQTSISFRSTPPATH